MLNRVYWVSKSRHTAPDTGYEKMNIKLTNNDLSWSNRSVNCGIRAIANYAGIEYAEARKIVKQVVSIDLVNHRGMLREEFDQAAAKLGLKPVRLLERGTLEQHAEFLGDGIYSIENPPHLTAVVNGVSVDNNDYRNCVAKVAYLL